MQDNIGLTLQQLVFSKLLWAPVDFLEGLHPIEAIHSWVSEAQDMVK